MESWGDLRGPRASGIRVSTWPGERTTQAGLHGSTGDFGYTGVMALWKRRSAEPEQPPKSDPVPIPARDVESAAAHSATTMFLSGDTRTDRESVAVLLDAIAQVSASRDLESLLDYVVDAAVKTTKAERGLLVLVNDDGTQEVRIARTRDGEALAAGERYSTSSVKRVVEMHEPMRTTVSADSNALDLGASVFDLKLRAVMCVPLGTSEDSSQSPETTSAGGNHRGALYVDSKAATREFTDENLALFNALAHHIGIALENARLSLQAVEKARLENALQIASEIQSGLMPKAPKTLPGFDVFGWFLPAEHATGDFYGPGRPAFLRQGPARSGGDGDVAEPGPRRAHGRRHVPDALPGGAALGRSRAIRERRPCGSVDLARGDLDHRVRAQQGACDRAHGRLRIRNRR